MRESDMQVKAPALPLFWIGASTSSSTASMLLGNDARVESASVSALADFLRGNARCHVVASGEHAASVLAVVHERAAQIDTLTLLSPPDIAKLDADLAGKLKALEVPTLLLFGAVISPHPTSPGTQWRRAFAKAHLVYIYDAEEPVEAARPEAVASVMADFMARKDGFLVRQQDDRFHP